MAAKRRSLSEAVEAGDRPLPTPTTQKAAPAKKRPARKRAAQKPKAPEGREQASADELARAKAGIQRSTMTKAERAKARRAERAAVWFEVSIDQKAELLAEADELGLSLGALIRFRLYGDETETTS